MEIILLGFIACILLFGAFIIINELLGPGARWVHDRLDRWIKWRDVRDIYQTRKLR